jgi:hypothetical protein
MKNLVILGVARDVVVQAGKCGKLFTLLVSPLSRGLPIERSLHRKWCV